MVLEVVVVVVVLGSNSCDQRRGQQPPEYTQRPGLSVDHQHVSPQSRENILGFVKEIRYLTPTLCKVSSLSRLTGKILKVISRFDKNDS